MILSFLIVSDGNPPPFSPHSTLLKLRALLFIIISEFKVLNSLITGDGNPPSFSPLSKFSKLRALNSLIVFKL